MLFTEEQSDIILNNPKNLVNQVENVDSKIQIKPVITGGKILGHKDLTTEERILIGTVARAKLSSVNELAEEFNLNRRHVSNLSLGRTTYTSTPAFKPHPELEAAIKDNLGIVQEKAIDLLLRSIGVITDEKLAKTSAKDASSIAANASKIVSNCMPKETQDNRIQVVMYAPRQKELKEFDVIEA